MRIYCTLLFSAYLKFCLVKPKNNAFKYFPKLITLKFTSLFSTTCSQQLFWFPKCSLSPFLFSLSCYFFMKSLIRLIFFFILLKYIFELFFSLSVRNTYWFYIFLGVHSWKCFFILLWYLNNGLAGYRIPCSNIFCSEFYVCYFISSCNFSCHFGYLIFVSLEVYNNLFIFGVYRFYQFGYLVGILSQHI